jgi:hypothetical protein
MKSLRCFQLLYQAEQGRKNWELIVSLLQIQSRLQINSKIAQE